MNVLRVLCPVAFASLVTFASMAAAATISFGPSHDTMIWHRDGNAAYDDGNFGSTPDLDVYHFDGNLNAYSYVQFDISSIGGVPIESATLTLTKLQTNPGNGLTGSDRGDTLVPGRIDIFGLLDVAGNTPQNWDESTLTFNTTGDELTTASIAAAPGAPFGDGSGLSQSFAGQETITTNTVVDLTGTALVDFLQARADADGLVTFMVANPDPTAGRGYALGSKESDVPPVLTITTVPEPSSLVMIGLLGVGLAACGRRVR